jgi:hypothetical protein
MYYVFGESIVHTIRNNRVIWSSARVLKCSLKWGNERNPCPALYVSRETALFNGEEGEDDVKSAWPSDALGYTHATMAGTMGCQVARRS